MGRFSRWMPPTPPRRPSRLGGVVLAGLLIGVVFLVIRYVAVAGPLIGTIAAVSVVLNTRHTKRLARLVDARAGEDIGTFARALDRRTPEFDPWVVRAVWDALQPYAEVGRRHVPLRPGDRLLADLDIDSDDLEDLAVEAADRAGRDAETWQSNPANSAVETVGDLVRLVSLQPGVAQA